MLPQQIATADLIEIIFEGRNILYGAYPLRKEYGRRLKTSLLITGLLTGAFVIAFYLTGNQAVASDRHVVDETIIIEPLDDPKAIEPPPPPPPPPPPHPTVKIATDIFTTPKIVSDKEVKPEDQPPAQASLEYKRIGLIRQDGIEDARIVNPPLNNGNGVIALPVKKDEGPEIHTTVEIESEFPGGQTAWKRFLLRTLRYPSEAQERNIGGTVIVKFVVDTSGNVSNVEATHGAAELQLEAVRVIKKSGKWTSAIQNGRKVKSYKQQAITFLVGE